MTVSNQRRELELTPRWQRQETADSQKTLQSCSNKENPRKGRGKNYVLCSQGCHKLTETSKEGESPIKACTTPSGSKSFHWTRVARRSQSRGALSLSRRIPGKTINLRATLCMYWTLSRPRFCTSWSQAVHSMFTKKCEVCKHWIINRMARKFSCIWRCCSLDCWAHPPTEDGIFMLLTIALVLLRSLRRGLTLPGEVKLFISEFPIALVFHDVCQE